MSEQWRDVVGYEGLYQVSSEGRVRSLDRTYGSRLYKGKLMNPSLEARSGYRVLGLHRNNKSRPARVHNLVLEAFVGPRPPRHDARHLNGDPTDNRLENLAWGTRRQNCIDAQIHGTWAHGESHGNAKLTAIQAQAIFLLSGLMSRPAIAEAFGVSVATIQGIHDCVTWRVARDALPEGVP